jgi:hypothetical protein
MPTRQLIDKIHRASIGLLTSGYFPALAVRGHQRDSKNKMRMRLVFRYAVVGLVCAVYASLELGVVAGTLRQIVLMPLVDVCRFLPSAATSTDYLPSWAAWLDVDVEGVGAAILRTVAFTTLAGVLAVLVPRLWRTLSRWVRAEDKGKAFALAAFASVLFLGYLLVVIQGALFTAWEPDIPGQDVYGSTEHLGYALSCVFGDLWWVTFPAVVVLSCLWHAALRTHPLEAGARPLPD